MVNDVINPNNLLKVCVIASDMSKCLAINTWRDEDQELEKVIDSSIQHSNIMYFKDFDRAPEFWHATIREPTTKAPSGQCTEGVGLCC